MPSFFPFVYGIGSRICNLFAAIPYIPKSLILRAKFQGLLGVTK